MPAPTADALAAFLGHPNDDDLITAAEEHLPVVTAMVKSYTRGRGFDPTTGAPADDLAAVITTATARLVTNPQQLTRQEIGVSGAINTADLGSFTGWSLAEIGVLHAYRRRSA